MRQFNGFVEIGDVEIGVGDIVDQSQARVCHILPRGLVFPDLRVGGGTEFAPQIQFVAQAELAAEGVAVAAGFQVLDVDALNEPLNDGTKSAPKIFA